MHRARRRGREARPLPSPRPSRRRRCTGWRTERSRCAAEWASRRSCPSRRSLARCVRSGSTTARRRCTAGQSPSGQYAPSPVRRRDDILRNELLGVAAGMAAAGVRLSGPLTSSLIAGGRSNLTFRLDDGTDQWVLRTPPRSGRTPSAHDVARVPGDLSTGCHERFRRPCRVAVRGRRRPRRPVLRGGLRCGSGDPVSQGPRPARFADGHRRQPAPRRDHLPRSTGSTRTRSASSASDDPTPTRLDSSGDGRGNGSWWATAASTPSPAR